MLKLAQDKQREKLRIDYQDGNYEDDDFMDYDTIQSGIYLLTTRRTRCHRLYYTGVSPE